MAIAKRHQTVMATAAEAPQSSSPALKSLDMNSVLSLQGYINPEVPPGTGAIVFAIYDQSKTLQYIGFSKELRASLLNVFSRRPDKCHFYRAVFLPELDQQVMVDIRSAWFDQNSGPPPGNKLAGERAAWQAPAKALAMSDRGRAAAAEELAKQMMVKIESRGCKEEFILNPDKLPEGEVEFLGAAALSPEEIQRQRRLAEEAAKAMRQCTTIIDGEPEPFELFFSGRYKTNGGHMFDVRVTFQERESSHRVIVGSDYYEEQGLAADEVVERAFAFLLRKKVPRRTEGMLTGSQFTTNYFSISEVHQFFPDFQEEFEEALPGDEKFWRFNRTKDYGYKGGNEDAQALAAQFRLD